MELWLQVIIAVFVAVGPVVAYWVASGPRRRSKQKRKKLQENSDAVRDGDSTHVADDLDELGL